MVGIDGFVNRFTNPGVPTTVAGFGGTVEPKLRASIVATLNAQHNAIKTEEFTYRDTFEKKATEVTKELLANSKKKIEEEQTRYGIKLQPMAGGSVVTDVGNTPELSKMQAAAKLLLPEKRAVGAAHEAWDAAQQKVLAKSGPLDIRETVDPALIASEKTSRRAYTDQEDKYRILHDQQVALFPALAMFAGGDETVVSLELLATANPKLLGQHIGALMAKKLENIATVQKEIGGRFNVWKQPTVMTIAGNQLGTKPWLRKAMDEHARQLQVDGASSKIMWAAVAIGLGLLAAVPTGGVTAISAIATAAAVGGAGVSAYNTYEEIQKASLASAASGTDLDKAKSISKDDPSWFWLAADIVGTIADVFAAGAAFKALKTAIVAAKGGKVSQLRPLIDQVRTYGLSAETQAKVLKEVVTGEKITTTINEVLEVFRNVAKTGADKKLAQALNKAAKDMIQRGKVLVLKNPVGTAAADAEIEAFAAAHAFSKEKAADLSALLKRKMTDSEGLYYGTLDLIIARGEGSAERVSTIIAHELTHSHQKQWLDFLQLGVYEKELQAWMVEGQFLRMLPPGTVPPEWRWLATATLAEIETKVLTAYPASFKVLGFRNPDSTKIILESLRGTVP